MSSWLSLDWNQILLPHHPVEMVVRGTLVYLGLLILMRIVLKRQSANLGPSDLLVTVLIADAIQNGMSGEYKSVTDGLLLVSTLLLWDFVMDWLAYYSEFMRKLIDPPPLPLVRNGQMIKRNMRREFITESELMSRLRQEGVDSLQKIKSCFLESDGEISVIKKN